MLLTVNCLFIFIVSNVEKDLPKIIIILFKIICHYLYLLIIYFTLLSIMRNRGLHAAYNMGICL